MLLTRVQQLALLVLLAALCDSLAAQAPASVVISPPYATRVATENVGPNSGACEQFSAVAYDA
ncbi:MAG TPA: hypothetical protein VJ596_06450, partial [Gemmatimonadaceae bacterium]|nr:hypothetical protein [Gemmatimonadaceae bacterium]